MNGEIPPAKNPDLTAIIAAVVVVAAVLAGGWFLWKKHHRTEPAPTSPVAAPTETKSAGLGGQIYEQIKNPAEKLPETNPFETKTNPFTEVYKNPFE